MVGPGSKEEGWKKPIAKFESRVSYWAGLRLGMAMNAVAFNIYIVPVLEYIAQLMHVTDRIRSVMSWAMRKLASGPGNWVMQKDLENLTLFGFAAEFRTIETTARAAKLRLLTDVAKDATQKQDDIKRVQAEYLHRPFGAWHSTPLFKILDDNRIDMERVGINMQGVRKRMKQHGKARRKVSFQKVARQMIKSRLEPLDIEERIRHKVKRWRLVGPPAHLASRIARNIKLVGKSCRPCVTGMMFRTIWNGWPTTARMRSMPNSSRTSTCLLGCPGGEDRIEHYLVCEVAWRQLPKPPPYGAGISIVHRSRESMLLADKGLCGTDVFRIANSCYAIARTVQCLKSSGPVSNPAQLLRMFLRSHVRCNGRQSELCVQ